VPHTATATTTPFACVNQRERVKERQTEEQQCKSASERARATLYLLGTNTWNNSNNCKSQLQASGRRLLQHKKAPPSRLPLPPPFYASLTLVLFHSLSVFGVTFVLTLLPNALQLRPSLCQFVSQSVCQSICPAINFL